MMGLMGDFGWLGHCKLRRHSRQIMRVTLATTVLASVLATSCSDDNLTSPSGTERVTHVLTGTISPLETQSASFAVNSLGTVDFTFVSLARVDAPKTTLSTAMTFGFGQQLDTECRSIRTMTASTSLTTQISALLPTGSYCVLLTDTGTLPAAASFAIRVVHP